MGHGGDLVLVNPLVITQFDVICIDMSGSENERPSYRILSPILYETCMES